MTRISILAALFALPASALLADNLERLEAASELGGQQLSTFLLSRAPELEPNLPSWEWDDTYRQAGRCFLDNLETSQGADGVERYLSVIETYAARPITSLDQTAEQPPEMMAPPVMAAMQTCGVQQEVMKRMTESGLMGAMMNPETMSKLGG
ncbi:hypothetical protein [Litoreibacter arenae]|uniref:Uncharacterized protein n=1 Tax=Litoreibacter arenae DSM 19593 TaxID=1123360 RepID=S9QP96_9RHOB|nr:hypothetical protein [Litoreibacter arenae]EPX81482.1 hypothetical protein thalar_00037 [Litoreibacter arenae DSM 19593]